MNTSGAATSAKLGDSQYDLVSEDSMTRMIASLTETNERQEDQIGEYELSSSPREASRVLTR